MTNHGGNRLSAFSFKLPEQLAPWVQLLPAGTFMGRDGRGPYTNPDPAAVISETRRRLGADLPIDYGHALELAGVAGDAAPAAGWVSDLEVRDGQIWGRVAWTASGEKAIAGREYRFLSPVFWHDEEGQILWILRAGLTNRPNLAMTAINSMAELAQLAAASQGAPLGSAAEAICARLGIRPADFAKAAATGRQSAHATAAENAEARAAVCARLGISEAAYERTLREAK